MKVNNDIVHMPGVPPQSLSAIDTVVYDKQHTPMYRAVSQGLAAPVRIKIDDMTDSVFELYVEQLDARITKAYRDRNLSKFVSWTSYISRYQQHQKERQC